MSQLEVDKIIPQSGTTLTIGDSGDTITIASGATLSGSLNADNLDSGTVPTARLSGAYTGITQTGTLTSFASTGIDDNALSTAITISSGKNITFGGSSIFRDVNNSSFTLAGGTSSNVGGNITVYGGTSGIANGIKFRAGGTETMRIDSSGNLLVGKTSANTSTVGAELRPDGLGSFTRSGTYPIIANRTTSDGDIISIRKDGTVVGSIATISGDLSIGTGDTGINFYDAGNQVLPFNTTTNNYLDNTIDLGSDGYRFNDLYLGGGLYVGGTASANKLDDYEEGTWTPAFSFSSGGSVTYFDQDGRYTKIGNLVAITVSIATSSISSPSGNAEITGLPFTPDTEAGIAIGLAYRWGTDMPNFRFRTASGGTIQLFKSATNANPPINVQGSDFISGSAHNNLSFSGVYRTTA